MQEGLIAVCTVSPSYAQRWAAQNEISVALLEASQDFEEDVLNNLKETAISHPTVIQPWEIPVAVIIIMDPWTEVTATYLTM